MNPRLHQLQLLNNRYREDFFGPRSPAIFGFRIKLGRKCWKGGVECGWL